MSQLNRTNGSPSIALTYCFYLQVSVGVRARGAYQYPGGPRTATSKGVYGHSSRADTEQAELREKDWKAHL